MRSHLLTLAAGLLATLAFGARPAQADGTRAALIGAKAPSTVSVKITLKVTGSFGGGGSIDREQNLTTSGVVVDGSGLVMVTSNAVSFRSRPGMEIKVTPTSIRVIFPGDETEYEAILGAVDSKLGLAYLLIRDLKGRKADPFDMSKTAEPAIGDVLYAVTRLGQGYDYAPVCQTANVVGQVTKPRAMWVIDGEAPEAGQPLYTAQGAVAGIMISQEGVGEGGQNMVFLLPLKIALSSIERSLKASQKELEDVKAREAEAAAKPAEKPAEPPAEPAPAPEQPK
jgi:hypothetical protein